MPINWVDFLPDFDGYTPDPTRPRDPNNPDTRPDGTPTNRALRNMIPDSTKYFESINPMYTQAQPFDAFAPMRMYQRYLDTGRLPSMGGSGAPVIAPSTPTRPPGVIGGGLTQIGPIGPGGPGYSTGGGK
jgi:hypothetical protein